MRVSASRRSTWASWLDAAKAERLGLVGAVLADREALLAHVAALAGTIAAKPARAVRGIKQSLLYARDHTVAQGLVQAAEWNATLGFSPNMDALLAPLRARTRKS